MNVSSEKDGPITIVRINRPERRNAIDAQTALELADAMRTFDADQEARVAILFGEGGFFCAGADLKAISAGSPNRVLPDGDGPLGPTRMTLSKPVIAAVAGPAVAGGLELALWCDLRVAEETATFGVLCRRWGVPLIDGGTVRLPRVVGLGHALDMILTGRSVDAQEAWTMGLCNRVVPAGQALAAAKELALQIAAFPQVCMRNDRRSALDSFDLSFEDAMRREFELGMNSLGSGEGADGAGRFASGAGRGGRLI